MPVLVGVLLPHQNIDQQTFAEDALWIGTNPDFSTIPDSNCAAPWYQASDRQFYKCLVGSDLRPQVTFNPCVQIPARIGY